MFSEKYRLYAKRRSLIGLRGCAGRSDFLFVRAVNGTYSCNDNQILAIWELIYLRMNHRFEKLNHTSSWYVVQVDVWLVVLGLTALWDSISVYIGPSPKEREKRREKIEKSKNVQTTPTRTYCKRNRLLPYYHPNCRTPRHWKFTKDNRTTRPPQSSGRISLIIRGEHGIHKWDDALDL